MEILQTLEGQGYKEVVLTGIHLGQYGLDLKNGMNLTKLLNEIADKRGSLRIRLSSLEPTEIGEELMELMAGNNWLCRHFHISLQNGDDTVLKMMNRHYTAGMFSKVIHEIHRLIPQISVGVDILVGFPGEDDGAFCNTLSLLKDLPVSYFHVFPYSKRKGTAAAKFSNQIDEKIIKERTLRLRSLDKEKRMAFRRTLLGQTFSVLAEGWAPGGKKLIRGLSDNYVRFSFPSDTLIQNEMLSLKARHVTEDGIIAQRSLG
jgi:threonylcarbamoyladenosine tRNA methylthiotransferase MtaB